MVRRGSNYRSRHVLRRNARQRRKGSIVVFAAFLMIVMLACIAFAVDLGYLYIARTEAQACADSAALAAGWEIIGDERILGNDDVVLQAARNKAIQFALLNPVASVNPILDPNISNSADGEIVFGRLINPADPNETLALNDPNGVNAVLVRVKRTTQSNGPVNLFFAQILGMQSADITAEATAMFRDNIEGFHVTESSGNSSLMPFVVHIDDWNSLIAGGGNDDWSYDTDFDSASQTPDGIREIRMFPESGSGNSITPGNFGTVNIGSSGNGASALSRIIREGPSASDLELTDGVIELDSDTGILLMTGDPGMTASIASALGDIVGQPRTIMLYSSVIGQGNNTVFSVVGFAGIRIMSYSMTGNDKHILVQPTYVTDPTAVAGGDGSNSYYVGQPIHLAR